MLTLSLSTVLSRTSGLSGSPWGRNVKSTDDSTGRVGPRGSGAVGLQAAGALDLPASDRVTADIVAAEKAGEPILDTTAMPSDTAATLTDDEAVAKDADWYAGAFNVTKEEAVARTQAMTDSDDVVVKLREALPERFAGIWLEHEPKYRMVVRFTGGDEGLDDVRTIAASSPIPVEVQTGAELGLLELLAVLEKMPAILGDAWASGSADERTGRITVSLMPGSNLDAARLETDLEARFGVPVSVAAEAEVVTNNDTYGGRLLNDGFNAPKCTTGFSVQNSGGATGVATIGHCTNLLRYADTGSPAYFATTFVSEVNNTTTEVQWSSVVGTEFAKYWDGTAYRTVSSVKARATLLIGSYACHWGRTTGYSCGTIDNVYFAAGNTCVAPSFTSACAATWIRVVDGPVGALDVSCSPGDSGGPWFVGSEAYGIHKASTSSGGCVWMAQDCFYNLGVSIMVGP